MIVHENEAPRRARFEKIIFDRVFGYEIVYPPQFQGNSGDILKKCGGVPLAIITIARHEARSLTK